MPEPGKELEPAKPAPMPATIELSKGIRLACAVGGALSVGFAGVALWRVEDGAATVAFVAFAALLLIFAIAGVVPRRIKQGDSEVEITRDQIEQAAIETADVAIETMTPDEIKQFITDNVRLMAQGDPTGIKAVTASRAQNAADFENRVYLDLIRMFPGEEEVLLVTDSQVDFLISKGAERFGVVCKLSLSVNSTKLIFTSPIKMAAVIVVIRDWEHRRVREVRNFLTHENASPQKIVVCEYEPVLLGWILNRVVNGRRSGPEPYGAQVISNFPV